MQPFNALVVLYKAMNAQQQVALARALVSTGAAAVAAWGVGCKAVHDAIDDEGFSQLGSDGPYIIMTTWHDDETLEEAMDYFKNIAFNPDLEIVDHLIIDFGDVDRGAKLLALYDAL